MIQTQRPDLAGHLFPFSDIQNLSISIKETEILKSSEDVDVMELPVNNYLKTPMEIEMEFQYGINPRKIGLHERKGNMSQGTSIMNTDGYLNIHDLDQLVSGFMEENY